MADPREQELQMVLRKSSQCSNRWTIFSAPGFFLLFLVGFVFATIFGGRGCFVC